MSWLATRERGSVAMMRLLLALCAVVGRRGLHLVLRPIALYYALFDQATRAASREYLRRVLPAVRFRDVYRHVLRFAQCASDRFFLLSGRTRGLSFEQHGNEHLRALARDRRGAMLIGAHLGSFEAMRASAVDEHFEVVAMMYLENARKITALLREVAPDFASGLIEITPGSTEHLRQAREAIRAGKSVAVLADRVGLSNKNTTVDFLGSPALFATGPFLLAAVLRCPVFLTVGLYDGDRGYQLHCEPFLSVDELPAGRPSDEWARLQVERYARRLEHFCRLSPYNWFNFYDFWATPST